MMDRYDGSAARPIGAPTKPIPPVCADVKPRLTKEQHDILEAHFQQQHKPSTNTKKGFAESLGVPLDKINNWFQNRRAKVKQDIKKQLNAYTIYHNSNAQLPIHSQMQPPAAAVSTPSGPATPASNARDYYTLNTSLRTNGLSQNAFLHDHADQPRQTIELNPPQLPLQDYGQSFLQAFPQTQSQQHQSQPQSQQQQQQQFDASVLYGISTGSSGALDQPHTQLAWDSQPFGTAFGSTSTDSDFLLATLSNGSEPFGTSSLADFSTTGLDFSSLYSTAATTTTASTAMSMPSFESQGSVSPGNTGFSLTPSTNPATHSSSSPNASSSAGWTDDRSPATQITTPGQVDLTTDAAFSGLEHNVAATMPHGLPLLTNGLDVSAEQQYHQYGGFYQQANVSSHTMLSLTPEQPESVDGQSDLEPPRPFTEDIYTRRNSSTTTLTEHMNSVGIQSQPSPSESHGGGFAQPTQPSSIAARRRQRPAQLGTASLRSASYSSGMPSPGGNPSGLSTTDKSLRRIMSSGITNGRVQKPTPVGSAQRSPLNFTFSEAAASPKFARQASAFTTVSTPSLPVTTGGLVPPTPLTPNGAGRFPPWQQQHPHQHQHPHHHQQQQQQQHQQQQHNGSTIIPKVETASSDYSSPESIEIPWSMETPAVAVYNTKVASPPSTPLENAQINASRLSAGNLYRDTPPQSAPPTQQGFSRSALGQQAPFVSDFATINESTGLSRSNSHLRRPSLPDGGNGLGVEPDMQFAFPLPAGGLTLPYQMQYKQDLATGFQPQHMSGYGMTMLNPNTGAMLGHHPSASVPDLFIHEYNPPQGQGGQSAMSPPRLVESQPRSYVFANQGPRDFRAS